MSLVFVAPILLLYECGVLLLGPGAMRNGADVWLRDFLDLLGFGQYFLLPVMVCAVLLAWHHVTQQKWRVASGTLVGMLAESTLLGIVLLTIAQLQAWLFMAAANQFAAGAMMTRNGGAAVAHIIGFLGAGVYEELLFRLILVSLLAGLVQWAGESRRPSLVMAVLISSLLFSAAHYRLFTSAGDAFTWFGFLFRVLAGIFFSVLFLCRGFGITVGTHTLYDVLVGYLLGLD